MAGWVGFSEEELRRLKQQKDPAAVESPERLWRPPPTSKNRQQLQRERALQKQSQRVSKQDRATQLLPDQKLSRPQAQQLPPAVLSPSSLVSTQEQAQQNNRNQQNKQGSLDQQETTKPAPIVAVKAQDLAPEEGPPVVMKEEVELREKSRLEHLQLEQRLMEEKNKRKKALLAKAIAERSRRTQAEAVKLKQIQKELQTLDNMVSNDIGILRNRIEQASWEYSQARKRFDKAEVEYVAAKLDLHKKTEIKEQLAEHLCAIIQQNELRKAKKLEDLMQLLEMETDEERLELEIEVDQMLQQQQRAEEEEKMTNTASLPHIELPHNPAQVTQGEGNDNGETMLVERSKDSSEIPSEKTEMKPVEDSNNSSNCNSATHGNKTGPEFLSLQALTRLKSPLFASLI
ncbi:RAB6-interacting golgin [Latimeria chalumnae]|uniref:RAB6-interacting golgin n=1 Tax=Latimeria chalumnae TaxID=7897 RepID=UPI0003C18791|nr:PREDICTED: RAB6-interacting golgin isoform X2 [Latimeria chalumnae]|eukprot:XP_006005546.1 PREDICTED: RAB6-interacting golgin isoform X2 [Latimeria chalumnae]